MFKQFALPLAIVLLAVAVFVQSGDELTVKTVDGEKVVVGAFPGGDVYNEVALLGGLRDVDKVTSIAATSIYSTSTLRLEDSGTTYSVSASGTTITLPAVANAGANFKFVVGGAVDTGDVIIDSAEGDNVHGTLIVAGAVVDCEAEDQINFVNDGENVGDFVEVVSDGTSWIIGQSGALTTAKLTCSDPS